MNIQIMRAFNKLRRMLATRKDLRRKVEDMESKYDDQFRIVFEAIRQHLATEEKPERKIGFVKEDARGLPFLWEKAVKVRTGFAGLMEPAPNPLLCR